MAKPQSNESAQEIAPDNGAGNRASWRASGEIGALEPAEFTGLFGWAFMSFVGRSFHFR